MGYVVNMACVKNKEKHFTDLQFTGHRGGFACYGPLATYIQYVISLLNTFKGTP